MAHTVLGGLVGLVWLVLPGMTITDGDPVPPARSGPVARADAAPGEDETDTVSLILPLALLALVAVLGGYGYVRRTRRARTRTTPGALSPDPTATTPADLEHQARAALVAADDSVRTSRAELEFVRERSAAAAVERFAGALHAAEAELAAAFAIRYRYEQGLPADAVARRQALAGIIGRCAEAGRRLDAEAAGFDRFRALDSEAGEALEVAERRFRALTGRTSGAQATLAGLRARYAPSATEPVAGYVDAAKDRLVFATARLNRARQSADSGASALAARHLRAAEGAVAQADVLVSGVERLARRLDEAARLLPAALTGAETELTAARRRTTERASGGTAAQASPAVPADGAGAASAGTGAGTGTGAGAGTGPGTGAGTGTGVRETAGAPATDDRSSVAGEATEAAQAAPDEAARRRLACADAVLDAVRGELTGGPYDPVDALRRVARAVGRLGSGREGAVSAAAWLVAQGSVAAAEECVATHQGVVGAEARTRLAEARRRLAQSPAGHLEADELAVQARSLADADVRTRATPYTGTAEPPNRAAAGAVVAGILLGEEPDAGPPAGFGGPGTRDRHRLPPP